MSQTLRGYTQEGYTMEPTLTPTARTILIFRERAESMYENARTLPIWGVRGDWLRLYEENGICYRQKDAISEWDYAARYNRAADWLESRASAATLASLYPFIRVS
jgi:hypothetical protein